MNPLHTQHGDSTPFFVGRGSFLTLLFGVPFAPELADEWPYDLGGAGGGSASPRRVSHMGSLAQKVLTFAANIAHSG